MSLLLSIVTITYNNLEGLKRTCRSLDELRNHAEVEWIVVDGGSTDETVDFLNAEIHVRYSSEPDKGIYDAMNKGIGKANGKYLWFLNAGDIFNPHNNSGQLIIHLQQDYDVLYSDTLLMDANMEILGLRSELTTRNLPARLDKKSLIRGMVVGHQSFIVKREHCPLYDLQWNHVADYEWMIRVLEKTNNIHFLPIPLACFDTTGHSSLNRLASNKERMKVMAHHFGWLVTCGQHLRIIWVNLKRTVNRKSAY
jgi:glycosyltransferase involved in cell wall biosynthesis